jgi:peptidyl-prolyl cis-trans isomerase D
VRADSIAKAIAGGANFDTLETKYSSDQVAHKDKGVMTFSSDQIQAENFSREFAKFILFDGKAGDKKVVKTDFGEHYIEILEQKNIQPHYKVAYYAHRIDVSNETDNNAKNNATLFAGEASSKSFDAAAERAKSNGVQKLFAPDLKSHDGEIMGLGEARSFIKKVFDADKGDIIGPELIGDKYIVAVVTEINKKGVATVAKARQYVEPVIRNKKKAAMIKAKIGTPTSLETVATMAMNTFHPRDTVKVVQVDSLRFNSRDNTPLSFEGKVVGASFFPANNGKVIPEGIEGTSGVYVVRVENVGATVVENADIKATRKSMVTQGRMSILFGAQNNPYGAYNQRNYDPAAVLKKSATIKDYRNKFY